MSKPLVTIGLAAYNGSSTIKQSIEALFRQSFRDFRLIVSDDYSVDMTFSIACRYREADSRVVCVRQPKNLGPMGNFSFLLDCAETEFFMWASQDDLWSENYLDLSVMALLRNREACFTIPTWRCTSRSLPGIRRLGLPSLAFLESPDKHERLIEFTKLPFRSFKDNITYGVYRTRVLRECNNALREKIKYFSIGGVRNEYNIIMMRGLSVPAAVLIKRYKWVPPGHCLNPFFGWLFTFKRLLEVNNRSPLYPSYTVNDYMSDLRVALAVAGVDDKRCNEVIGLNEEKIRRGQL